MQVKRVLHLRTPLVIRNYVGKREIEPTIIPDKAGFFGGGTIILEGDTDKPGFVTLRESRCRFSDNYARKLGRKKSEEQDPIVVELRNLPRCLKDLETSMLLRCVPALRRDDAMLHECVSDWDHVVRHFLPFQKKEQVEVVPEGFEVLGGTHG